MFEANLASIMELDPNEEYLLQWRSHNFEVVQEFYNFCKDDRFTDCTIAAEDETFRAHRVILSGCSPYFKSLFEKTSCSSPVIVLKDISAVHFALLLRYMYLGVVSVRRDDLHTVLKTANSLRIRGLTTGTSDEKAVAHPMDGQTATIHPTAPPSPPLVKEGRKGYVPKKLRANPSSGGDNDSIVSSPRASSSEGPVEPEPSGVSPDNGSDSPEGSKGESVDEEQPWNLSQAKESGITIGKAKFPILGNYLKNGNSGSSGSSLNGGGNASKKMRTGSIDELLETIRMNNGNHHINNNTISSNSNERRNSEEISSNSSPVMSSQSLAQSWLDQLSLVKEEHHKSNKENPGSNNTTMSLSEAHGLAGIDIAERIRAMTAPFSQTYGNLLNNVSTNSIAQLSNNSNGDIPPPPSLTSSPVPRNNVELGEIGPNGKPSVTCEVCGKKLADPSSLYRHRKIHSGDKPHKCPFCSRRFIQRYNMKQHMKTHRIDRIDNPELAAAIAAGDYAIPRKAKNI